MRAVLDANVLVSSLISRTGAPARLIERWLAGHFDVVVSEGLLAEVERALTYPKVQKLLEPGVAAAFVRLLRDVAEVVPDPSSPPPVRSQDPGDDYLLALAARERTSLVSGDSHLLALGGRAPVLSPRDFLAELERVARS